MITVTEWLVVWMTVAWTYGVPMFEINNVMFDNEQDAMEYIESPSIPTGSSSQIVELTVQKPTEDMK